MNARGILKELGKRVMLWSLGAIAVGTLGSNLAGLGSPATETIATQIGALAYLGFAGFIVGFIMNMSGPKSSAARDTDDSPTSVDSSRVNDETSAPTEELSLESKARSQAGTTMVVVGLAICLLPLFLGIFSPVYLWLMFFAVPIGGVVLIAGFVQTNRSAK